MGRKLKVAKIEGRLTLKGLRYINEKTQHSTAEIAAKGEPALSIVQKQSIICFSKRKFVCQKPKGPAPVIPLWQFYLYPPPKSARLQFFNEISKEIYEFAYVAKQSQFKDYLNGQRQFHWKMMKQMEKLTST